MLSSRRRFNLALLSSLAACSRVSLADTAPTPATTGPETGARKGVRTLTARATSRQLAPAGYPPTPLWLYEESVPGPTLRFQQGERVPLTFVNQLPEPSTIHWHGIRIDNAMDGVPGLTQAPVAVGDSFAYDFVVPDAGTYWYHSHNRSWEQVARGLHGALIVDEPEGLAPPVDRDELLLLDDWRLTESAQLADTFGNLGDWSHGGRIGNWLTVNGQGNWAQTVEQYQRLRLRLVNAANARIFTLRSQGLDGWVVALDGMPLEQPQPLSELRLAPAQRVDLIVDVVAGTDQEAMLISMERSGGYVLASFPVSGKHRNSRQDVDTIPRLPPNPVPDLGELASANTHELLMQGGAMGGLRSALMDGKETDARSLAAAGKLWAFNGRVDWDEEPLFHARRGETVSVQMSNDTAWPHAMHLHGHHFRTIDDNGRPGPLRDTVLIAPNRQLQIAFIADNPGDWLLHCHMLEHATSGMRTWFRVS